MWLILSEPHDSSAQWLVRGLQTRATHPVEHFTSSELTRNATYDRGVDSRGAWFRVVAADGRSIDSREVRGIVNRICALPPGLALRHCPTERRQLAANAAAPLIAHLHSFPGPVLNRPVTPGVSGDFRVAFEWFAMAERAGLAPIQETSLWGVRSHLARSHPGHDSRLTLRLAVIGERVVPLDAGIHGIPADLALRCRHLAQLARATLLGIDLVEYGSGDWRFARANLRPAFEHGAEPVLNAIAHALNGALGMLPGKTAPTTVALPRFAGERGMAVA